MRIELNEETADKLRAAASELNLSASSLISLIIDITLSREGITEFKRIFYSALIESMEVTLQDRINTEKKYKN